MSGGGLTAQQQKAAAVRGNLLVVAGAGTGKTRTLVQRCVDWLLQAPGDHSLEQILMVTFTDAAAAEMRQRIRQALAECLRASQRPGPLAEQLALLDSANISTLHSFCYHLLRQHFYELDLDPQLSVMAEEEARLLAQQTLSVIFEQHFAATTAPSEAVRELIQVYARGWEVPIKGLVLDLHHYAQTLPDADGWLKTQVQAFSEAEPRVWREWLRSSLAEWSAASLEALEPFGDATSNVKDCRDALRQFDHQTGLAEAHQLLQRILAAHKTAWPKRTVGKIRDRLKDFFRDADFLHDLTGRFRLPAPKASGEADMWRGAAGSDDPLVQDWAWVRPHMLALLGLVQEFGMRFKEAKRELGAVDFHDLEQFSLRLLWDSRAQTPTRLARNWQEKLRLIFVDEYQDINAAQDAILRALSRGGAQANRFLVGDPKQSIYRFRLANPGIFQQYAREWRSNTALGQVIPLTENFRSRSRILQFVNTIFEPLMRREVGGVDYSELGLLTFGQRSGPAERMGEDPPDTDGDNAAAENAACLRSVEIHLRLTQRSSESESAESADNWMAALNNSEKEARLIGLRLAQLRAEGRTVWDPEAQARRPVQWGDMVILLRSPQRKVEAYAKEFSRLGIPLVAARGGLFESAEIMDVLSLLTILDNPVQDIPLLSVLRSPFVALSFDELAVIRLAAKGRFWNALLQFHIALRNGSARSAPSELADPANKLARALLEPEPRKLAEKAWVKVHSFLERFGEWRRLVRHTSLSDGLERILRQTDYRAFLRDGARGEQQRGNLSKLLAWTRRFDQYQRQGLFHFLKFIEAQKEAEIDREPAPLASGDAVRLMSIHQSKGLEFGVVVLADIGKPFNISDLKGTVILDEAYGLCPLVKPPTTEQRYPSLPHWLAQRRQRRELLGEELRLLYVAMTRARQCLILAGTAGRTAAEQWTTQTGAPKTRELLAARGYLDWIGPRLGTLVPNWLQTGAGQNAAFVWQLYTDDATSLQPDEGTVPQGSTPSSEPDPQCASAVLAKLQWQYPAPLGVGHPAKLSVSTLRAGILAEIGDGESPSVNLARPERVRSSRLRLTAAAIGSAHHTFLQHVDLANVGSQTALAAEARRLEEEGILSRVEREALDLASIAAFWKSQIGAAVLEHSNAVRREQAFTARMSGVELHHFRQAETAGVGPGRLGFGGADGAWTSDDEFVVITGAIDLSVHLPNEIWIVDFKTDSVTAKEWETKTQSYGPQMRLYALALSRIYGRPVAHLWLHSLALRTTEDLQRGPPRGDAALAAATQNLQRPQAKR